MTNRIPLIVNAGAAQIQEVSSSDVLTVPGTLTANTVQTNHYQYANGQPFTGGGGGGNTFSSITLTNTPINAANIIQYGLGNLVGYLDGQWTIGEYNGNSYGTEGIRINPGIEGAADIYLPANQNANVDALTVSNYSGNVAINTATGTWTFDYNGNVTIPGNLNYEGVASPAPSINGFDSVNVITVNVSGNISAVGNVSGDYAFFSDVTLNDLSANAILYTDADRMVFNTDFSYDADTNTMTGGNISLTGNVTAGDISAVGNVYATNIVAEAAFEIQVYDFAANIGGRYGVDTQTNTVTATLPASPPVGGAVFFADAAGAYNILNLIIDPNGQTIMGTPGNMTVSTPNQSVGLFWNGTTWRIYNAG